MATINILSNKPATASSYVSPFTASRTNNGTIDVPSRWLARITTSEAWITIDAGDVYYVNRWVAKFMGVAGWGNKYNMSNYTLQSSIDGSVWTVCDTVVGNTSSSTDRTVATFRARYFRMSITAGPAINPKLASVVEFEVYSAPVLTALAISAGTLTPAFAQGTNAYTATVPNSISNITVTPTAGNYVSAITVNGTPVTSGQASAALPLVVGANTIAVNVTEGSVINTYTIIVTRQQGATLSGLTAQSGISSIPLLPTPFASSTLAYTTSVGFDISSIAITPTEGQPGSTITVNGTTVASGSASGAISLNIGDNTIPVVVSVNGASQTYTVKVTRADSSYLSALTVQSGTAAIPLSPTPFVKTTIGYSATVGYDVSSVTVIPTAESPTVFIMVNGSPTISGQPSVAVPLVIGSNTISVMVSAGGVMQNYVITITRVDTSLSNLVLKAPPSSTALTLSPVFQSSILEYTLTAAGKNNISFTPTAPTAGAIITVGGTPVNSGSAITKPMNPGSNPVLVVVTVGNVSTTYKVTVTK